MVSVKTIKVGRNGVELEEAAELDEPMTVHQLRRYLKANGYRDPKDGPREWWPLCEPIGGLLSANGSELVGQVLVAMETPEGLEIVHMSRIATEEGKAHQEHREFLRSVMARILDPESGKPRYWTHETRVTTEVVEDGGLSSLLAMGGG